MQAYFIAHMFLAIQEVIDNIYLQSEKNLLWDCIYSELEDKIRRLEDDRNNTDISSGLWLETLFRRTRKHGNSGRNTSSHLDVTPLSERRRKPVTVSGPYIVYMLTEAEILEDWTVIKKALAKRKSESKNQSSYSSEWHTVMHHLEILNSFPLIFSNNGTLLVCFPLPPAFQH